MKLKAGIIGSGNIGTDLLIKALKSSFITPVIFIGRRSDSEGIKIVIIAMLFLIARTLSPQSLIMKYLINKISKPLI